MESREVILTHTTSTTTIASTTKLVVFFAETKSQVVAAKLWGVTKSYAHDALLTFNTMIRIL